MASYVRYLRRPSFPCSTFLVCVRTEVVGGMIKEEEEPSILSGQPSSVDSLFVRRGTKHWSERCDGAQKEVDPFASSERGAARAGARQTPLVGLIDVQSLLSVPTPR